MKKIWIGSSWKMNKNLSEVDEFCDYIHPVLQQLSSSIQSFLIPPYPYVERVSQRLKLGGLLVGVQNICWAESGAFTGEVSAAMARDIGASIVEIGHSERRAMFNETDSTVNLKVKATLKEGLIPLICVGDTLEEKRWGVSIESIVRQVKIALFDISETQIDKVIIAYEPVWAIGENGIPANAEEAEQGLRAIKHALFSLYRSEYVEQVVLLYGGSVNLANAAELISQPSIDGLFIGRSAWLAKGYAELLEIATHYTLQERR